MFLGREYILADARGGGVRFGGEKELDESKSETDANANAKAKNFHSFLKGR